MKKYSQQQLKAAAYAAVERAESQPQTWQNVKGYDDEVVYSMGLFTIGSNGDCVDYHTAWRAGNALADLFITQQNNA